MYQITARVPDDLAKALDEAAAEPKRSCTAIIRQALERYLASHERGKVRWFLSRRSPSLSKRLTPRYGPSDQSGSAGA